MKDLFGEPMAPAVRRTAEISACGRYRYTLRREWDAAAGTVCFVMLNPSTADALVDDPTIRRCIGFARSWGYGAVEVRNLFALRATDPKELLSAPDPVGPKGDESLRRAAFTVGLVVVAWGASVPFGRDRRALELLEGTTLACLGLTKGGGPRHPLYVRGDARPSSFA